MAQYYQIVGQDHGIQTVTLEELRQYYPTLTCVESSSGVQYVINQEETSSQFQSQQVLLTSDQQIVLNSGDASQQIIVDQSQITYQQTNQQYTVQENEVVSEYQQVEINNTPQPQQQIYYTTTNDVKQQQQLIQTPPANIINPQINQRQLNSQIINTSPRVVSQSINPTAARIIAPQQINNAHLMTPRRIPVNVPPQQIVAATNIPRPVAPTAGVRLQYTQPIVQQEVPTQSQPQLQMEQDDNQIIVNEGRVMTLGQFKHEFAQTQQENISVHQSPISNQSVANCIDKQYKQPSPKRNYNRRSSTPSRGRNRGGRGAQNSQMNHTTINISLPKPFQQLTNTPSPKPIAQYSNPHKNLAQNNPVKQSPVQHQVIQQHPQRAIQPMHHQPEQLSVQTHQTQTIPQPQHQLQQMQPNMLQHNLQPANIQPQPYQANGRIQPLIPLSPQAHHNGQNVQKPAYTSNATGHQYLDDSNSSLSDEYKDSARMLVCLENGEQRLITFTLPKESCTVQDLLEQVGVPFNADTKIECISNPGNDIDYIVNVGAVNTISYPIDAQQVLSVESLGEPEENLLSQTVVTQAVKETKLEVPPTAENRERLPEPPKEIPKFVSGFLAVCNHCGYLSEDFNRCQRCKTKLPEDVKSISTRTDSKQNDEKKTECSKAANNANKSSILKNVSKVNMHNVKASPKSSRGRKPKAQELEPVVLTLSSDDEDVPNNSSNDSIDIANRLLDSTITQSVIQKEPIIIDDSYINVDSQELQKLLIGIGKEDELRLTSRFSTTLSCRTVRIGSYKFYPKEEITITSLGIKIAVPLINDPMQTYRLFIPIKFILKVLACFNKSLPVLFFYVTPSIGSLIRGNLEMKEGSDLYFDPLSKEEPFKRITLLPEVIVEDVKVKIKDIFLNKPYKMLEELSSKEANDILIRTCPRETNKISTYVMTSFSEVRQLLIYPPGKGGIAINAEDYLCLAQDQFLNDVIIDFYLKYLVTNLLANPMQEKVYIFSSFFYKRLTTKPAKASKRSNPFEVDPTLSAAEKRHSRVKSWTKNVNIFEKDYIIIPINENSHWFLAIICYPGLEGCRSMMDADKIVKTAGKKVKKKKEVKKEDNVITIGNTTITLKENSEDKLLNNAGDKPIKCEEEEGSDRDEAEGDESELEDEEDTDSDVEDNATSKKRNVREPIKQACILIFDSLSGAGRSRVVATLRDYLTCEYKAKMDSEKIFTKDVIKGACPKVPQQTNFTDCGLYVLQYVESFFKAPIPDYHIPIKNLRAWFDEIIVTRKREDIANLIKELMQENGRDPGFLPDIVFPTVNGELVNNTDHSFTETEEEFGQFHTHEEGELVGSEKTDNSIVSELYNSDSSVESPPKPMDTTSSSNDPRTTRSFVVTQVNTALKPDLSEFPKKSNRETMSYLKSKRISRHKNNESNDLKKQKLSE